MLRAPFLVLGSLLSLIAANGTAARDPDIAYTVPDDVDVRSGPGTEFYVTQRLPAGSRVEIYRREGDWLAIRPPLGSFSWLPGDALTCQADSNVAHTTKEVRTRIGSLLADDRNVAYVTLHPGEAVRLLETSSHPSDPDWYRIEPPAGEFRWIQESDINSERTGGDTPSAHVNSETRDQVDDLDDSARTLSESLAAIRKTMQTIMPELADAEPDSSQVILASGVEPAVTELAPDESIAPPSAAMPSDVTSELLPYGGGGVAASGAGSHAVAHELTNIAAELCSQISRSPSLWDLASLRRRTQAVIDVSDTATLREHGTHLLARIAQFEDIQRRHRLLARKAADGALTNRAPLDLKPGTLPPENVANYDGYGWLMPVVTQNRRVPRYVLTDQQGNILQFVTPSPGLSLSRYENQKVGIYGTRGFLPSMKQPHLVAERVVTVNSVR